MPFPCKQRPHLNNYYFCHVMDIDRSYLIYAKVCNATYHISTKKRIPGGINNQ